MNTQVDKAGDGVEHGEGSQEWGRSKSHQSDRDLASRLGHLMICICIAMTVVHRFSGQRSAVRAC